MKRYIAYILTLVALVGCNNKIATPTPEGEAMSFATPLVEQGRSTLTTSANVNGSAMGVYGLYEVGNEPIFEPNLTDHPQAVTYSGGDWTYTPLAQWKQLMNHKFRAFYPYDADGSGVDALPNSGVQEASCSADRLVLDYYTQVNKFDLMVAYATRHPYQVTQGGGNGIAPVVMPFKHALSALRFKLKHGAAGATETLTAASLSGVSDAGVLMYNSADGSVSRSDWTLGPVKATKLYSWTGAKTFSDTTTATAFGASDEEVIFAIPQQMVVGGAKFHFDTASGAETTVELPETEVGTGAITWEPGKLYEYTITVKGAALDVKVTIKEWNDIKSNVDIYIGN